MKLRFLIEVSINMPDDLLKALIFLYYRDWIYIDIYYRNSMDRMEYYCTSRASEAFVDGDDDDFYYRFSGC